MQKTVVRILTPAMCLALSLAALGGCSLIYKQTVAQGNLLEQATVDTLQPGMSKRQVALILGTPAVQSPFHQDRWNYVYSYKANRQPIQIKQLHLSFTDGALAQIEGDFKPGGKDQVFKPEDSIIEATKEYQRALSNAEKEKSRAGKQ
jgi:outer membrane protein assembly factor BamE